MRVLTHDSIPTLGWGFLKPKNMKALIQSAIYQVEARITQYKTSELFSEDEKKKQIAKLEIELEALQLDLAKEIEVNDAKVV